MKLRHWSLVLMLMCCAAAVAVPTAKQAGSAQSALESARKTAVVDGNLPAAIKQYQAIVDRYAKTDRAATAEALLGMADAYKKIGDAQAQKVYEQIVKDYADQPAAVSQARENLRSTGISGPQVPGPRLVQRLDPKASELKLSPDGQTVAMYGLSLLDLATGKTTRLDPHFSATPEELKRTGRYEDAEWPVLTRDSKQLAYEWYVWDGTKWSSQLRVMSTEAGARPRILVDNPEFTYFTPVGWANDGRSLLTVITRKDDTNDLAWVSTADGAVTTLQSLGRRLYRRPSLSPDGRFIAYSALTTDPGKRVPQAAAKLLERHIYVLASDGSSRAELTLTTGVVDHSPVWTSDGTSIVFSSNRSGTFGLWSAPVKDGKAAGPVSILRGNTGEVEPLGITPTGALYYTTAAEARTVSVVSVTRGSETTSRVTDELTGSLVTWSPDGKTLAVVRPSGDGGAVPRLVLHSVATGEERSYSHDGLRSYPALWFRDGKRLLVAVAERPEDVGFPVFRRSALFSLDHQSGVWTRVLPADFQRGPAYMAPDDSAIYHIGFNPDPAKSWVVMKVDLVTGSKTQVFDFAILPKGEHDFGNLSPDGRMWAVRSSSGADTYVHIVPLDGGGYRELYHASGGNIALGLQWSSDSRTIYWGEKPIAKAGAPPRLRIMQIAAAGGPVSFSGIELDGEDNSSPLISPDGSHVALTKIRREQELWALDLSSLLKRRQ